MRTILCLLLLHHGMLIYSMELKGTNSCQIPILNNSKILTSSSNFNSHSWCPSSFDSEPYMVVSLSTLTYITRLHIKTMSSNMYYHLEYTRDDLINQYTIWRSYRLLNNKFETIQLDPPIIVKYIRLSIKQMKVDSCFQMEIFGCLFTDGVISYSMLQGNHQLEDDTYDGHYNVKHRYLYDGLGQLSDGQTGPDNHEDFNGFQWIGWRKPRLAKQNHSIELLFKFDTLRNFSRIKIHANNYYPKRIYVFRMATIEFLYDNKSSSSSSIVYHHQRDDQFEMARPIMIDLKYQVASQIRIQLYFDGNWILISEITFDSFIVPNNLLFESKQEQANYFSMNVIIIYILLIIILLIVILILSLTRYLFTKNPKSDKTYCTPIHNHTDSSLSTTSSEIDVNSSHHRYATIGSAHQCFACTNGNMSPVHYTKLMSTTSLLQSPAKLQQYHIEGVCGNSAYGTQKLFTFDLSQHHFIPIHQINIKQQIYNRHQILGGGQIFQGELQVNQSAIPITIRRLLPDASIQSKISFFNEISLLTTLCHPNILHAYGFCSQPSISILLESNDSSTIDLYQYLQQYRYEQPIDNLLYTTTIFFATQISSALAYLESLQIYHRDVAARNCLVTIDLNIKLQDLAMCNETYADDYVLVTIGNDIQVRRPIRWCAWETICLNRFTSKSDVFSFGVLLWEILTMAERPHSLLDDDQVLFNIQNADHNLLIPSHAGDLIDLILSCWHKCDYDRPTFHRLNQLLNQKQQQQLLTFKSDNYQPID